MVKIWQELVKSVSTRPSPDRCRSGPIGPEGRERPLAYAPPGEALEALAHLQRMNRRDAGDLGSLRDEWFDGLTMSGTNLADHPEPVKGWAEPKTHSARGFSKRNSRVSQ